MKLQMPRVVLTPGQDLPLHQLRRAPTLLVSEDIPSCVVRVHEIQTSYTVFQQIDVEDSADTPGGGTGIRMFGVTEVTPIHFFEQILDERGF